MMAPRMDEAIERFGGSGLTRELFGEEFVRVYAAGRAFKNQAYKEYLAENKLDGELITDWEYQRFLELV